MARKHRLDLLLNDVERDAIAAAAMATGLSMAAYARQSMMIAAPANARARAHVVDRAAVVALNAVGSNLNQIAKVANATKTLTPAQIQALAALYKKLVSIVRQIESPPATKVSE